MGQRTPERETTLNLPPCCFAEIPTSGEVVLIVRGAEGYHPVSSPFPAAQLNATLPRPPTAAEIEAMLVGSMFGWDVPGAKPACHAAIRAPQESKPPKENVRRVLGVAAWGGPDAPLRLSDNSTIWPRPASLPDPIRDLSGGHLGYYGWLGLVDIQIAQTSPWTLSDFPGRNWREDYDGRVPPEEAADIAVDERIAVLGIAPPG